MDSFVLYGPGGASPLQIGSWVQADPGIDFGAAGLLKAQLVDSPFSEGALSFEEVGPRRMTFPLFVGSGPWGSLTVTESLLRSLSRPGGYIDVQPEGVASAEAVRFDILSGRWEPAYRTHLQRVTRRQGSLLLDTSPYGYWPTWITLASVASMGLTGLGRLTLATTLGVQGDAPALVELTVVPTTATQLASIAGAEAWFTDGFAWGNGGRASFLGALGAGSWTIGQVSGTYWKVASGVFSRNGPLSATHAQLIFPANVGSQWYLPLVYTIPSALEPAYRGRFRGFGLFSTEASRDFTVALDVDPGANNNLGAMGSAAQLATVAATYGPAWAVCDLGEITLPAVASGVQAPQNLRLWVRPGSYAAVATTSLAVNGVYLLPLGGEAGIVARGIAYPTIGNPTANIQTLAPQLRQDLGVVGLVASVPAGDLRRHYSGLMPGFGATVQQLDLFGWQRKAGGASAAVNTYIANSSYAAVSVRYRPRFQFLKGI